MTSALPRSSARPRDAASAGDPDERPRERSSSTSPEMRDFELLLSFAAGEAVVAVRGELDVATSATLGAVVAALADGAHAAVVLDLAGLRFIDAAGLGAIAGAASRLQAGGRSLVLRDVPVMAQRLLTLTGVGAGLIETSSPTADRQPALPGEGRRSALAQVTGPAERHGGPASTAGRDALVDAALRLVTVLADATVAGAEGVSVSLERRGRLATVAASDERSRHVDGHQYGTGQGPCLAAAAEGHRFHSASLAEEGRWPDFVPLAIEAGMASILSSPLVVAERSVGSLNIYSTTERSFGPVQHELAALFAEQASAILREAEAIT